MTNFVKKYNGVHIYVSPEGEFYCDVKNNSSNYYQKTFNSLKLQSIEKAIDNYSGGSEIDGKVYYDICRHSMSVKRLKVVKKVGERIFFNDGKDSSDWSRKDLYPREIEKTETFKRLKQLQKEKEKYAAKLLLIQDEFSEKMKSFKKVQVS